MICYPLTLDSLYLYKKQGLCCIIRCCNPCLHFISVLFSPYLYISVYTHFEVDIFGIVHLFCGTYTVLRLLQKLNICSGVLYMFVKLTFLVSKLLKSKVTSAVLENILYIFVTLLVSKFVTSISAIAWHA